MRRGAPHVQRRQHEAGGIFGNLLAASAATPRDTYGFRTYEHAEIALYHALGDLPEPDWLTHRFC